MRRLVDPAAWLPDEIGTTGYRASDTVLPAARWPELAGVTGLNSATRALVARIEEDGAVTLDALGEVLTRRFDVPRMTALSDVAGFVQQAQGMGALTFRSSMWSTVVVRVRPFVHFLSQPFDTTYWFTAPRRRYYPASAVGVIRHAAWSQFMIGVVVAIAFGGVVLPFVLGAAPWTDIGGSRATTTPFIVALLAGFTILGVLHDVAHYVVARRRAPQARQLYVDGLRLGLQYRSARRTDTLAITTGFIGGTVASAIASERHRLGASASGMVMTLIIIADEENQNDATLAASHSAGEHPCRIITVTPRPGREEPRRDAGVTIGANEGRGGLVRRGPGGPPGRAGSRSRRGPGGARSAGR